MRPIFLALAVVVTTGCASSAAEDESPPSGASEETNGGSTALPPSQPAAKTNEPAKGETTPAPASKAADLPFKVLTYNVAGLPEGVSKSHPAVNTPQISPKLNAYDLVVVQEDFSYHDALISSATHPYESTPAKGGGTDLGDGLNTLSKLKFTSFTRTKWQACNGMFDSGSDCLTPKGFTRFVVDLGGGREVDFYDVHFDAGRDSNDAAARGKQVDQLAAVIASQSKGRAVIVAGDTNMKVDDEATVLKLLSVAGLSDACRTLKCGEPERIDRVMYRSSTTVVLAPQKYAVESWLDSQGEPLSDHEPVSVDFVASSP